MAEPMGSATAANAVADLFRAGLHHALAPGTHEGGQEARGVGHLFHDWGVGQERRRFCSEKQRGDRGSEVSRGRRAL
jgi:hypothetical protein